MDQFIARWLDDPTVRKALVALLSVALVWGLVRLTQRLIARYVHDNATRYRGRKLVSVLGYVVVLLLFGGIFSNRLGQLAVVLGVAGAGIALALQELIASAAGWAAVAFGGFYRTGDRIQLGGVRGDVIDIGILRTTLMECGQWVNGDLYNGRIVRVANNAVFKDPVFNYSADFPFLWDEITIPIRYGSDWEFARESFRSVVEEVCRGYAEQSQDAWKLAVRKYQLEPLSIHPMITLAANDNWIAFTMRYIVDYRERRAVKDRLFTRILEEVDRSNNRVRLASATFELTNLPRLDLDLTGGKGTVTAHYVP